MLLDRVNLFGREGAGPVRAQRAEGAVALMAPGAAGDLRHLGDAQPALAVAVKLAQRCERDMRHIHIQPHADRIGGDEIIDLARLEHRHLGVAGARGERAHHHRRAAAQPPQHLGDRIDFFSGEGDDHRSLGQPRKLARAAIAQRGKARAGVDDRIGHQRAHHRPQTLRAQDHRFVAAARAQQPIGEDMAALGVCPQLRLVERDEAERTIERHAFGRAQEPARARRHDPLLAGDERDFAQPLQPHHPVIHLAREQPQREADHAARMRDQPLDREMRLAGIGGAEHGDHRGGGRARHDSCQDRVAARAAQPAARKKARASPARLAESPFIQRPQRFIASRPGGEGG